MKVEKGCEEVQVAHYQRRRFQVHKIDFHLATSTECPLEKTTKMIYSRLRNHQSARIPTSKEKHIFMIPS